MSDRDLYISWGRRVREARESADMRQADLAKAAGTYQQIISGIESGRRPADALRPRIATALGVDPADLFPYPDDREGAAA